MDFDLERILELLSKADMKDGDVSRIMSKKVTEVTLFDLRILYKKSLQQEQKKDEVIRAPEEPHEQKADKGSCEEILIDLDDFVFDYYPFEVSKAMRTRLLGQLISAATKTNRGYVRKAKIVTCVGNEEDGSLRFLLNPNGISESRLLDKNQNRTSYKLGEKSIALFKSMLEAKGYKMLP